MRVFVAYDRGVPVLEFELRPGFLVPAGQFAHSGGLAHPFLNARALEPSAEDTLRTFIERSTSGEDFHDRLLGAGYEVRERSFE